MNCTAPHHQDAVTAARSIEEPRRNVPSTGLTSELIYTTSE